MTMREKKHRLPREYYRGNVSVAFTLCLKRDTVAGFTLCDPEIVNVLIQVLTSPAVKTACIVPVYCFMPDHQHMIISGTNNDADLWNAVVSYKQRTGFWLARHKPSISWQKDFYDHIIRKEEDLAVQVRYILDNPVRKGIVASGHEYPYKGAIGCDLNGVLNEIMMR